LLDGRDRGLDRIAAGVAFSSALRASRAADCVVSLIWRTAVEISPCWW